MATTEDQMAAMLNNEESPIDILDVGAETYAEEPQPVQFPEAPPMETSRGAIPDLTITGAVSIETALPGGYEEPALDWSDKSPENNAKFYERYFAPYRSPGMSDEAYNKLDGEIRGQLSKAVGFRMQNAPDTSVDPATGEPVFKFFGGYQGKLFTENMTPEHRARVMAKYGATDLVYATKDDVTGRFVQPTFTPVAAVEELRAFKGAYEAAEPWFTMGADVLSEGLERRIPDLILGTEAGAGKFVDFMERKGVTNPFILRDLAFMQATGHLDYLRKEAKGTDTLKFLYNYTIAPALDLVDWISSDSSSEVKVVDADGKEKVNSNDLIYGANKFAQDTGLSLEQAESAFAFNKDIVAATTTVAPEVAVDLGVAGGIRTFFARRAYKNWTGWIESQGAKSFEELVEKTGRNAQTLFREYLDTNVMRVSSKRIREYMKAQRVESLDIYTGLKKLGGEKYRSKYLQGKIDNAVKEYDSAKEDLLKIPAAQNPRQFKLAQDRVTRAENQIRRLDAESRYPEYFAGLAKEFMPAILGAGTFAQIVQDSAQVTDGTVLSFAEIGGAVSAAFAPGMITGIYKAPVMLTAGGVEAIFNIVTGRSLMDVSRVPAAAKEWLSQLQKLEPEQYDQVVSLLERGDNLTQRMLEVRDPNTGEQLFRPEDVQLTVAEMLNIPLLRIHQQSIADSATVADIASFNRTSQEINKRISEEVASLDRMAGALDRLARIEDPQYAEMFPELQSFAVDMRSMHTALKQDLEDRLSNLTGALEAQEQDALLYLTGQKFDIQSDGSYFIPDYATAFENADNARLTLMKIQGVDEDQILEQMQVVADTRLQMMVEAAEEMRILRGMDRSPDQATDPSVLMAPIVYGIRDAKERAIDIKYRTWEKLAPEDTFMDGRWIFDDLMRNGGAGLDDETLASIGAQLSPLAGATAGARRIYGADLNAQQRNGLNRVFGAGAEREMKHYEQLFEETDGLSIDAFQKMLNNAGTDIEDNGFTKWLKVHDYLANATEETIMELDLVEAGITVDTLREFASKMTLPVSPTDMRLVASAFGRREFDAARGRLPQAGIEPGRAKRNFYAMAESEEYGFRSGYYKYNEDGTRGKFVGKELVDELRDINTEFKDDIADRYRQNETIKSWTLTRDGRKAKRLGGSLQYKGGKGPGHWYSNLAAEVSKAETPAQAYEALDEVLGMAFGGRKYKKGNVDTYVLDASDPLAIQGLRETLTGFLRQRLAGSSAARSFMDNLDADKIGPEQKEFIQRILMAKEPGAITKDFIDEADQKFFDAVERVRVYKFDDAGNIIGSEPLINMDDVTEIFSFKNLEKVNSKVAAIADDARATLKEGVQQAKAAAKERFTYENSYQFAARDMADSFGSGAVGRQRFFEAAMADDGLEAVDILRQRHINRIKEDAVAEYGAENIGKIDEVVKTAEEGFNAFVRRTLANHINEQAIGMSRAGEVVREAGPARALEVDGRKLDDLIGDPDGTVGQQRVAGNLKALLGDKHYGDVRTVADFLARKNAVFDKLNITGEARSLSIESWLSRVYSISRGVVSPRYVLSEFAIQQVRLHNQSVFQKAIADPEIARHIAEMVRTGDIPTGEAADRFNEAIMASIIRGIRESQDTQEIEREIPQPLTTIQ